jgi:hypothetical protein
MPTEIAKFHPAETFSRSCFGTNDAHRAYICMELGIYTFGDITPNPDTGRATSAPQRYREILAAAKLADDAGIDVFGPHLYV